MKTDGRPASRRNFPGRPELLFALPLVLGCAQPPADRMAPHREPPAAATVDTLAMRTDTRVLAHDSLGGRGTGTPGARAAARYIADRIAALGVRPLDRRSHASPSPYLLPVPLLRADVSEATLGIGGAASGERRIHGDGFVLGRVGREGMRAVTGPVAALPPDSSQVSSGAWLMLDRPLGEAALRWLPEWRAAGVAGLLVRLPAARVVDAYHDQLGNTRWLLAEGEPDPIWQPGLPVLMVAPELATMLLAPGILLSFDPAARFDHVVDYNVAGYVPGSDPDHAAELVVVAAHYDHLGTVRGGSLADSIFNGFSDNAAGVAMVLAIAESVARRPAARSILFLFPAAEEAGLLGSIHFVRQRASDVARTHAMLNIDAGAPPAPPARWRLAAGTRSWAGDVAAAVVEDHGWTHRSDPGSPNSDHWPFVQRGVPSLFLVPDGAWEGVDEEGERRLRARWDRYHQPGDEWHPEFPFTGLARYAGLGRAILYALSSTESASP